MTRGILQQVTPDKFLAHGATQGSRASLYNNTSSLKSLDLAVGVTLASTDDGTGVTHATSGGSGDASNERDNGLALSISSTGVVGLDEVGSILLGGSTNLTNHNNTVGLLILQEHVEAVDEVGTREGVTTNTDDERLAKTLLGGLVDGFVGQSTGTRYDTDTATLVNESGHDTDLAEAGGDDTGAVGSNETGLRLGLEHIGDADHVCRDVR